MRPAELTVCDRLCSHCFEAYAKELANRRQQLGQLARRYLPRPDAVALGLYDDNLLDRHTGQVISKLQSHGVGVPSFLDKTNIEARMTIWQVWGRSTWMTPLHASRLLPLGFTDLEVTDSGHRSFLEELAQSPGWWSNERMKNILETVGWALEHSHDQTAALARQCGLHGPQCTTEEVACIVCMENNSASLNITIGHAIARFLGSTLRSSDSGLYKQPQNWPCLNAWHRLATKVLSQRNNLESSCLCSQYGHASFSTMLTTYFNLNEFDLEFSMNARGLKYLITACDDFLKASHFRALFRFLTFEALSLTHSCRGTEGEDLAEDDLHLTDQPEVVDIFYDIVDKLGEMMDKDIVGLGGGRPRLVEVNDDCYDDQIMVPVHLTIMSNMIRLTKTISAITANPKRRSRTTWWCDATRSGNSALRHALRL